MRRIFRWTAGGVNDLGMRILCHSVHSIQKLFGCDADYFVCYNNLNPNQLNIIKHLPVTLIEQSQTTTFLEKRGCLWALIPNRIDILSHEVFIDNDVVLYNIPPTIDEFFKSNNLFFISHGLHKLYGNYKSYVAPHLNCNSGLFGIPPNFDFEDKIKSIYNSKFKQDFYDFQGIVTAILSRENFVVIPLDDVMVVKAQADFQAAKCGLHFVEANRNAVHNPWNHYRKRAIKLN